MAMSIIDGALIANATIASDYDPDRGKPPAPKIAIVTCADPRLTGIEQMLGLAAANVDMIRNFGTVIDDDAVRSLVLSTRLLGTREIMIINSRRDWRPGCRCAARDPVTARRPYCSW
jgi:carbonic anhydrase